MKIRKEESITLVIDYQEKLLPVIFEKERLIDNSCILLAGLRELEVPLIITQQYTKGLGGTASEITQAAGTQEYVEKIRFSSYQDVADKITGKKFVIICGIEAHICVLQTVVELKEAGYIPVLVTDCISSRQKYNMDMAFVRAEGEGAVLTTYESLLFELLEEAGTPVSKKIQRLVK